MSKTKIYCPIWLLAVGLAFISLAFSTSPAFACGGTTLCVDIDAPGPNHDGLTWATAYTNLQDALAAATPGQEIWVAEGVYYPDKGTGQTAGNQAASFYLKSGVSIYGGFSAVETMRSQRNWITNITVLSGDLGGNDLSDAHGVVQSWRDVVGTDNTYQIVTGGYYDSNQCRDVTVDATAVLDGFTITAGRDFRGGEVLKGIGAGLITYKSNPTLQHLVFSGNQAKAGGGIYLYEGPGITMNDLTFNGNAATGGGGLYCRDTQMRLAQFLFQNNETQNFSTSVQLGGGMAAGCDVVVLTNGQFIGNIAENAGGLSTYLGAVFLTQVTFDNNRATKHNTGAGGMVSEAGNPVLTDVTFVNNTSDGWGGGYYHQNSPLSLTRVNFINNTNTYAFGGGLAVVNSPTVITDTFFAGNSATNSGSGIYLSGQNLTMTNTVLQGNSNDGLSILNGGTSILKNVTISGNGGAGIKLSAASLQMSNSIVYDNAQDMSISNGGASIAYSILGGGCPSGVTCDHVSNSNPLFILPVSRYVLPNSAGNLRLQVPSPAIDAGDNSAVPAELTTDLDGHPRLMDTLSVIDTGSGTSPIVDMGAYEHLDSPDLQISLSNNVGGEMLMPNSFLWKLTISNTGGAPAIFPTRTDIVRDDLPSENVNYYSYPSIQDAVGLNGEISCAISMNIMTCRSLDEVVTLDASGHFTVNIIVEPSSVGTLINPRAYGVCYVDPNGVVSEFLETNNSCNSDTVTISQLATITLSDLTQLYMGTPRPVSVDTTPSGLNVNVTYNGLAAAPTNAGSYTVVATVNTPYYQGSATGTLMITERPITVTADAQSKVFGASDPALTYQITDGSLVASDSLTGSLTRTSGEAVSDYTIQQGTLTAGSNYALSFVGANLSILPAETTLTLSSSHNPATAGDLITFTAQVTVVEPGAGIPTGEVTFTLNGEQITRSLNEAGTATFSTSTLDVGTYPVFATYTGDGNYSTSTSSQYDQVVNPIETTLTLSSSLNPATVGDQITFTAQVAVTEPGADIPSGEVIFTLNGEQITRSLNEAGTATFSTSTLDVGTYPVFATYAGEGNYGASTSSQYDQVINPIETTLTLSSSLNPAIVGDLITFTAQVTVTEQSAGIPSGEVIFTINGEQITRSLNNSGTATFSTSTLDAGTYPVFATYAGEGNYGASTSLQYDQMVNPKEFLIYIPIMLK